MTGQMPTSTQVLLFFYFLFIFFFLFTHSAVDIVSRSRMNRYETMQGHRISPLCPTRSLHLQKKSSTEAWEECYLAGGVLYLKEPSRLSPAHGWGMKTTESKRPIRVASFLSTFHTTTNIAQKEEGLDFRRVRWYSRITSSHQRRQCVVRKE